MASPEAGHPETEQSPLRQRLSQRIDAKALAPELLSLIIKGLKDHLASRPASRDPPPHSEKERKDLHQRLIEHAETLAPELLSLIVKGLKDHLASHTTGLETRLSEKDRKEQDELRQRLIKYMDDEDLSAELLAPIINGLKKEPLFKRSREKILTSRALLRRFLGAEYIRQRKARIIRNFLDYILKKDAPPAPDLYKLMREFWGMRDGNVKKCRERLLGSWTFYAVSEEYPGSIVIGAIEIAYDEKTNSLKATEVQKAKPDGTTPERWDGYVFMRKDKVFVTMAAMEPELSAALPFRTPKFYILNPYYFGQRMEGVMCKLGKDAAIFSSGIYMIPTKDAPFAEVSVKQIARLRWLSREIRAVLFRRRGATSAPGVHSLRTKKPRPKTAKSRSRR